MYLRKLSLANFKNFREAELTFSPKINCFVGNNGAGKTNLLDAIYYLSFCKSFFNSVDSQNILHEEPFFAIHGTYLRNGDQPEMVHCIQRRNSRKEFRLNKKEYDRLADHIGLFPLVIVSPEDANLVNGGSEERRKYLDGVISQFDKVYLDHLLNYNKALVNRNMVLRQLAETRSSDRNLLEVWDHQMEVPASYIYQRRKAFLESFLPCFREHFDFISGGKEEVGIQYDSQLHGSDIGGLLQKSLQRDLEMRFSTSGIHKDDLVFRIGEFPIKKFGSQGQQKSFVIALKLAQFDYTKDQVGFRPILLFDDLFDKLDDLRVEQLIKLVGEDNFGQVFITETQHERVGHLVRKMNIDHLIFSIAGGVAEVARQEEL